MPPTPTWPPLAPHKVKLELQLYIWDRGEIRKKTLNINIQNQVAPLLMGPSLTWLRRLCTPQAPTCTTPAMHQVSCLDCVLSCWVLGPGYLCTDAHIAPSSSASGTVRNSWYCTPCFTLSLAAPQAL